MIHNEKDVFTLCQLLGEICNPVFQLMQTECEPDSESWRFYGLNGCVDIRKEIVDDEEEHPLDYPDGFKYSFISWEEDGFKKLTEDMLCTVLLNLLGNQ